MAKTPYSAEFSSAGGSGSTPGQETRSHMPKPKISHAAMKIENPTCCN